MSLSMQFDAVSENTPGDKWLGRWKRSWPAYRQWFEQRDGGNGPSRTECQSALLEHMPELLPIWNSLCKLTGDDDQAARFLSTWCPPAYLGGCSLAALSADESTRLLRNYDLSPELNEGLLLRTRWSGTGVMGMIEFLWGLSDGINEHGLAVALAFGGSERVERGFGITTILRYVMQTCQNVEQALAVLERVPSHMAYNIVLADASGATAVTQLKPGGGMKLMSEAVSTNHQHGEPIPDKAAVTQTIERLDHLHQLMVADISPGTLADEFLKPPLLQNNYASSMGTLFTADYDPMRCSMQLRWPARQWSQSINDFQEGSMHISFGSSAQFHYQPDGAISTQWLDQLAFVEQYASDKAAFASWIQQARTGDVNWAEFSSAFAQTHH